MGKKFSDQAPDTTQSRPKSREPLVFVVSSDKRYLESVLSQCVGVPQKYTVYSNIQELMVALTDIDRLNLAFALIVERTGDEVDALLLRTCKLDHPQLFFVMLLEECEQRSYMRFQSIGVQNILLPPFSETDLTREIVTALPNVPQFKRHPDLGNRGLIRLDFLIPSDLSYVLGVNYLISMLLKEFSFPPTDCRINIPLACDEALTNAIIHGNGSDPEKKVNVQIYLSSSRIKFRIKDQGEGFDVDRVANPTQGDNVMRSSGRGVYLIRGIMDSVEYKEGGRVVEMEKENTNVDGINQRDDNKS